MHGSQGVSKEAPYGGGETLTPYQSLILGREHADYRRDSGLSLADANDGSQGPGLWIYDLTRRDDGAQIWIHYYLTKHVHDFCVVLTLQRREALEQPDPAPQSVSAQLIKNGHRGRASWMVRRSCTNAADLFHPGIQSS